MSLDPASEIDRTPHAALLAAVRGMVHAERLRCVADAEMDYLSLKHHVEAVRHAVLLSVRDWSPPARPAGLRETEWDLLLGASLASTIEAAARTAVHAAVEADLPTRGQRAIRLQQLAETVDRLLSTLPNPPRSSLADVIADALSAASADARARLSCVLALAPDIEAVRALLRTGGLSALRGDGEPARDLETRLSTPEGLAPALRDWTCCQTVVLFDRFEAHLSAAEANP